MPDIIKNDQIIEDNWITVNDKEINSVEQLPDGDLLLPLAVWQKLAHQCTERNIAVWLDSDEMAESIQDELPKLQLIAINFPAFADGRGYTTAALLRQQYDYQGELRAIGDVLIDQLFYLKRVGFDSFALREDQNPKKALAALQEFSVCYQAASDRAEPLFRQRA